MLFSNLNTYHPYYKKKCLSFSIYSMKPPPPPNKTNIIITIITCSLYCLYKKKIKK